MTNPAVLPLIKLTNYLLTAPAMHRN